MKQRKFARAAALGGLLALGACNEALTYPGAVPFQADLAPVGQSGIIGVVSAVSQGRNTTETAIGIEEALPLTRYAWRIQNGTCATPGGVIGGPGAYPDFTTNSEGAGEFVGGFLNLLLLRDTPYIAAVYGGANRDQMVACGPLEEFEI